MPQQTSSASRRAYFSATEGSDVPVLRRPALHPGTRIEGPAIIEEKTSTLVLYPGHRAEVDAYLNIEVKLPS
jgi:N-methylhydantoinase A